jgi:tetratricopeptide (TPR) repeat protein
VASTYAAWGLRGTPVAPVLAGRSMPVLERTLQAQPDDVEASEAKGLVLELLARPQEALTVFEATIKMAPGRDNTAAAVAALTASLGRRGEAITLWQRALALDPWHSSRWVSLARLQAEENDWKAVSESCRRALRLNPALIDARKLFAQALLRTGDKERARAELQTLLGFDPPDRAELVRWFEREEAKDGHNP